MAGASILSDELLRQLIAVGQVDVVVGIPTLNNAASIATVVRAVHRGLDRDFRRERTVLIHSDGGSTDGTQDLVRASAIGDSETLSAPYSLRTSHWVSVPYHGIPGKGSALRVLFAAADLLQARALAVFDPETISITPDWVASMVRPVLADGCDFVAPRYARHPLEGPLITQLVRPLVRATYGLQLREPVASEFASSGRFASQALTRVDWESDWTRDAPDIVVTGFAIAGGHRVGQAALGPRRTASAESRPALPAVFRQVVGTVFHGLEQHEAYWLARNGTEPVPTFGEPPPPPGEAPPLDAEAMAAAFHEGLGALRPVLEPILDPGTLAAVREAGRNGVPLLDDALWVRTVIEFLVAHRRRALHTEHLLQALVPLYLGRTAAFVARGARAVPDLEADLEGLALEFERARPELVLGWNPERGR